MKSDLSKALSAIEKRFVADDKVLFATKEQVAVETLIGRFSLLVHSNLKFFASF
jgi:hypothetical protein